MTKLIFYTLLAVLDIAQIIFVQVPQITKNYTNFISWMLLGLLLVGLFSCGVIIGCYVIGME